VPSGDTSESGQRPDDLDPRRAPRSRFTAEAYTN
jgi:hypothetical protein